MRMLDVWKRRVEKKYRIIYKRGPSTIALVFAGMAMAAWAIFAMFSSFPVFGYLYYTVRPATSAVLARALRDTGVAIRAQAPAKTVAVPDAQEVPTVISRDVSLPEGHYLTIPTIGVDTVIWEGSLENYEQALKKGVWRAPDFADPPSYASGAHRPVILAAHRFGYLEWSQEYRVRNSFYNLPKLKEGDEFEILWDQHRYRYQVQRKIEGTEIDDYEADLILYTCKFLVSPQRVFVYAKLVN